MELSNEIEFICSQNNALNYFISEDLHKFTGDYEVSKIVYGDLLIVLYIFYELHDSTTCNHTFYVALKRGIIWNCYDLFC